MLTFQFHGMSSTYLVAKAAVIPDDFLVLSNVCIFRTETRDTATSSFPPLLYKKKQTDNKSIGTTGFSVLTYFRKDAKTEKIAAIKFYATFKTRHYPKYRVVKCLSITFKILLFYKISLLTNSFS